MNTRRVCKHCAVTGSIVGRAVLSGQDRTMETLACTVTAAAIIVALGLGGAFDGSKFCGPFTYIALLGTY